MTGLPENSDAVRAAAQRLRDAAATRTPCAPVRDLIGDTDVAAAYAVQHLMVEEMVSEGRRISGRKIGLTSPAVQKQLGVDRPDFGVLFADMAVSNGEPTPTDSLIQPKAEAEVAFVLAKDLSEGPYDATSVADAVEYAVAALEVVDSRVSNWDITFGDTVADNGSSALYVLGDQQRSLADFTPVEATMRMSVDGTIVSEGNGSACLGDPLNALAWLANTAVEVGDPLRAGQVVLSGALGPMAPVQPGQQVSAEITGLGTVSTTFAPRQQEEA